MVFFSTNLNVGHCHRCETSVIVLMNLEGTSVRKLLSSSTVRWRQTEVKGDVSSFHTECLCYVVPLRTVFGNCSENLLGKTPERESSTLGKTLSCRRADSDASVGSQSLFKGWSRAWADSPAAAVAALVADCRESITLMFPHLICLKYSFLSEWEQRRRAGAWTWTNE